MQVPDWGDAPEFDYPSLVASTDLPASANAQKKAKRKRKQQQEHLQALLDEPIQLPQPHLRAGVGCSEQLPY